MSHNYFTIIKYIINIFYSSILKTFWLFVLVEYNIRYYFYYIYDMFALEENTWISIHSCFLEKNLFFSKISWEKTSITCGDIESWIDTAHTLVLNADINYWKVNVGDWVIRLTDNKWEILLWEWLVVIWDEVKIRINKFYFSEEKVCNLVHSLVIRLLSMNRKRIKLDYIYDFSSKIRYLISRELTSACSEFYEKSRVHSKGIEVVIWWVNIKIIWSNIYIDWKKIQSKEDLKFLTWFDDASYEVWKSKDRRGEKVVDLCLNFIYKWQRIVVSKEWLKVEGL